MREVCGCVCVCAFEGEKGLFRCVCVCERCTVADGGSLLAANGVRVSDFMICSY